MTRSLAALFLALASLPTLAGPLSPFTASYHANINDKISGTASRELSPLPDDQLKFTFSADVLMAGLHEESEVTVRNNKVYPLRYLSERRLLFKTRKTRISFNWPKKIAVIEGGKKGGTSEASLDKGGLDPMALELQIRQDLSVGHMPKEYVLIDERGARVQRFRVLGEETIEVPAGKYTTLKVERIHDDPERQTQFWFAKALDYLPVRVLQVDDGEKFLFDLKSYTANGASATTAPATETVTAATVTTSAAPLP